MFSGFDLYFYTFSIFDAFADAFAHTHGDRLTPDGDPNTYAIAKPLTHTEPDALPVAFTIPLAYGYAFAEP